MAGAIAAVGNAWAEPLAVGSLHIYAEMVREGVCEEHSLWARDSKGLS